MSEAEMRFFVVSGSKPDGSKRYGDSVVGAGNEGYASREEAETALARWKAAEPGKTCLIVEATSRAEAMVQAVRAVMGEEFLSAENERRLREELGGR